MRSRAFSLEIRPVTPDDLEAVLEVYRQCEDFLALGPVPDRLDGNGVEGYRDITGRERHFRRDLRGKTGKMIGILDYVPDNYQGDPTTAYLSLFMLAAPFRNQGLGKAVVEAFEDEIRKNELVKTILAGVQVNNPQAVRFWQTARLPDRQRTEID